MVGVSLQCRASIQRENPKRETWDETKESPVQPPRAHTSGRSAPAVKKEKKGKCERKKSQQEIQQGDM